jgi:hypothetical protein
MTNTARHGSTARLSQIVNVQKGVANTVNREVTDRYHQLQRPPLLTGISRTYLPKDEDGDQLPPESTKVQVTAKDVLTENAKALTRLFDITATKDWGNCEARADVTVDGQTILAQVPATYLLFLEKQLVDIATVWRAIPLLDPAEDWIADPTTGVWRTPGAGTVRTRKVPRNHVVAEATERHPAQVQVYHEDVTAGTWTTVKFSGAIDAATKTAILTRVEKLLHAVKYAREEANATLVTDQKVGEAVFSYLLG